MNIVLVVISVFVPIAVSIILYKLLGEWYASKKSINKVIIILYGLFILTLGVGLLYGIYLYINKLI